MDNNDGLFFNYQIANTQITKLNRAEAGE